MKKIFIIILFANCGLQAFGQTGRIQTPTPIANTLQLTSGAYITSAGNSYIVLADMNAVVNNGNILLSNSGNTLTVTGSSSVNQSGTGVTQLNNLTSSTSGTYTLADTVAVYNQLGLSSGTLASAGYLNMKSLPANTAVLLPVISGTITGDVVVERYLSSQNNRAYRLLTPTVTTLTSAKQFIRDNWQEGVNNPSPSTNLNPNPGYGTHITGSQVGANGFDATQTGQGSLFTYTNTPAAWVPATNTNATKMDAKTGYLLYIRGDRSIDLNSQSSPLPSTNTTLRAMGSVVIGTQTYTGLASNDFSLIANPYPSAINWSSIYSNNSSSFANYYTYWDPNIGSRGGYVTVTNTGTNNMGGVATVNIQSGQAFFVNSITVSPTLTIQESDKSSTNNIDVFRTSTVVQKFTALLYYNDAEHGRRIADGVTALYDNSYNAAIDGNDAEEINNWDENIAIARAGKHLSIEERPTITTSDTISLFMNNMKQQGYEFEFNPTNLSQPNLQGWLVDNYFKIQTAVSLTDKTVIPFTINSDASSSATNRFEVVFEQKPSLPVVAAYARGLNIYPNPVHNNVINLQVNLDKAKYTINITNKLGQQILSKLIDHPGGSALYTLPLSKGFASGAYQLTITGAGTTISKQVIKN